MTLLKQYKMKQEKIDEKRVRRLRVTSGNIGRVYTVVKSSTTGREFL